MTDRTHGDLNAKVRAIIDDSIADLLLLGMESADQAAKLMATQAVLRVNDPEVIAAIVDFADSLIERGEGEDA